MDGNICAKRQGYDLQDGAKLAPVGYKKCIVDFGLTGELKINLLPKGEIPLIHHQLRLKPLTILELSAVTCLQ